MSELDGLKDTLREAWRVGAHRHAYQMKPPEVLEEFIIEAMLPSVEKAVSDACHEGAYLEREKIVKDVEELHREVGATYRRPAGMPLSQAWSGTGMMQKMAGLCERCGTQYPCETVRVVRGERETHGVHA